MAANKALDSGFIALRFAPNSPLWRGWEKENRDKKAAGLRIIEMPIKYCG
ncbi:MAG: hypothetical protein FWE85_05390 [Clostridiales bacterium]|nr:hypothetical protein [Clostridiales bacterium]